MDLNITQIALCALSVACGALGWFGRQVWGAVQDLKRDLGDMRVLIAADYVRYDRMQDAMAPVLKSLDEIKLTLAHKADK